MDAKLVANYRGPQAKPVFIRSTPKPRARRDLLTSALAGAAVVAVAALAVTLIPYLT